mgnify:FL=1
MKVVISLYTVVSVTIKGDILQNMTVYCRNTLYCVLHTVSYSHNFFRVPYHTINARDLFSIAYSTVSIMQHNDYTIKVIGIAFIKI